MLNVLVVEDNIDLLDDMLFNLQHSGYAAVGASSAAQMDQMLDSLQFDILLLDLGLPDEDGFDVMNRIKEKYPTLGIIMVTARSAIDDRVTGHQLGADHYLVKPVNYEELIAIIESLQRRILQDSPATVEDVWVIDKTKMKIQSPHASAEPLDLTWTEVKLLEVLESYAGQGAPKNAFVEALGGNPESYDMRRLETAMSRLRKKLAKVNGSEEELIKVQRGYGYQFTQNIKVS